MAEEKKLHEVDGKPETDAQMEEEVVEDVEKVKTSAKQMKKKLKNKGNEIADKLKEELANSKDLLLRKAAEFDNYRKRTEQEKAGMYVVGAKDIVEKILPVIDSFERGLAAVPEDEEKTPFVEGMNMIYKQFMKVLEDAGVTPIEAVGEEFNPDLHNAVMHIESDEVGDNIVVEELQKGYKYKDFVVRHSMVKVAN